MKRNGKTIRNPIAVARMDSHGTAIAKVRPKLRGKDARRWKREDWG